MRRTERQMESRSRFLLSSPTNFIGLLLGSAKTAPREYQDCALMEKTYEMSGAIAPDR